MPPPKGEGVLDRQGMWMIRSETKDHAGDGFICPEHGDELCPDTSGEAMLCPKGCSFPVVQGIPRFVAQENYAYSFGLQWKKFRKTQLDSYTGVPISEERLTRLVGAPLPEFFSGKRVLEAGCGAGRFTELMLKAGAEVTAIDLSAAVEANRENCGGHASYRVAQADIRKLPLREKSFDVVICIGVVQHTPVPEETIAALSRYVKKGGELVIDHYKPRTSELPLPSRTLRRLLFALAPERRLGVVERLARTLWPMHTFLYSKRKVGWFTSIRKKLLHWSPILDYQYAFPGLSPEVVYEFAVLDTHDCHTDYYQHRRTTEQIRNVLTGLGLEILYLDYAGNGVEARARRPQTGK